MSHEHWTYAEACRKSCLVSNALQAGVPDKTVIAILAQALDSTIKDLCAAESAAPKRYRLPDGRILTYTPPIESIPIEDLRD